MKQTEVLAALERRIVDLEAQVRLLNARPTMAPAPVFIGPASPGVPQPLPRAPYVGTPISPLRTPWTATSTLKEALARMAPTMSQTAALQNYN